MAFVLVKNVRSFLSPTTAIACRYRHAARSISNSYGIGLSLKPLGSSLKRTQGSSFCRLLETAAAAPSLENNAERPTEKDLTSNQKKESDDAQKIQKYNRFKTKSAFLKHFNEKLESGEVLTTAQAFAFLKSCGPRMVGETDASRNELVNYVWKKLEENGVPLQTGLWNTLLSVYVENNHDFVPLEFLRNVWEKSSAEPNKTTFSLLIQAYAIRGDPAGAMKIVEFMMNNNDARMTEHIYAWLVKAFAKKGDMEGVEEILRSMRESGIRPRHTTYGHLINAHAERGDLESVNKAILEMIDKRLYPTADIYTNLIDHLSHGGHHELIPQVWERIESMEFMNEDIIPLVQKCVTRGDYDSALTLLLCSTKQLTKQETYYRYLQTRIFSMLRFSEKDLSEYTKVIELFGRRFSISMISRLYSVVNFFLSKDEPETAIGVLERIMADKSVKIQIFHPILKYYADKKDVHGIVKVFNFVTEKGLKLDYYCYKNIQPAIDDMESEEYKTFISLIKENEKIILPFHIVSSMLKEDHVELSKIGDIVDNASPADLFKSMKSLKEALTGDFNPTDASKIIKVLHQRGMTDITVLIDEVMTGLVVHKEPKTDEALQFLKLLMENDVPISSHSYTKMLKSLHGNGMSDQFFMFVRLMKEHGIDPDVHQYYQMLKMAATVGNSMAAQFCFDKVQESSDFPDRKHELYEYLITAYGRDSENFKIIPTYIQARDSENGLKVIQLFEEMQEKNYRPSPGTITQVIKSYLLRSDVEGAKKVIEEYGEGKEQLRKSVKNSFMRAYVASKDFEAAENLFNQMKEESLLSSLQYNEMMRMCEITGDTERVESLYKEMIENDFQPNVFTYLHRIRTFLAAKQPEKCIDIIKENIASGKNLLRVDIFMIVLRHLVPTGNTENVKKVIDLIKEHHLTKVPPKRLDHALSLVYVKAGDIEEASKLLPTTGDGSDEPVEIELNPYRKVAKTASLEGDVEYIENIMKFLKVNGLHYQSLDTFYLLALNRRDDVDGIRRLYQERIDEGSAPTEKFMTMLESIIESRGIKDFPLPR
ncbi:leucine-rich PPR motif-containing protein, mitochondrial-like [Hydractinia symbiolongicarpus]|uniref:leucine-rich PPR motif-containing protein, mitochondrial-like n=1 Tax=Hydractinia symbiolongicarpus TaxID=13093 RepID=UPI00254CA95C|nr:leucine-rich PPR motif-containing protein, mitochondrial-like [Hydractinia symbiolongicarpus]